MTRALLALLVLLAAVAVARGEDVPRLAEQRIVLRTIAGDIILALYPDIAPEHTKQLLKLAKLGVFDTTYFYRYEPGFVLQLSTAEERSPQKPLTAEQRAAIHPLRAEFSALKHRRGILSMAHEDNQPDSGATSFSIHLGDAPHLDGNYTVFGHVESGMDVVEELIKVPCNGNRPRFLLEVTKAEVANDPAALSRMNLAKAHALPPPPNEATASPSPSEIRGDLTDWGGGALAGGVMLMMSGGLVGVLFAKRLSPRVILSLHLITVLIGSFVLLMLLVPLARYYELLGMGLFFGLLGLLKLMGRFESPG
jgi:cyclophilin family peptidyl-prolyl cis-trans isomerase